MKITTNPFSIETSILHHELIVDRTAVLDRLFESISNRGENVLVFGEHGIGKSCLLKKLRERLISRHGKRLLILKLDMMALSGTTSEFLATTIQMLIEETWVTIFGRKYSELLGAGLEGKRKLGEQLFRQLTSFIELFRLIRPQGTQHNAERSSQIGGSVPIAASRSEKFSVQYSRGNLKPSEFLHLAGEIIEILRSRGVRQIVIFGDEANHIRPELELDLFRSNFEMFSQQNVQFVFAANKRTLDSFPKLREAFPVLVDLREFEAKEHLDDLLFLYSSRIVCDPPGLSFSEGAKDKLWKITKGHPREIQRICQRAVELAVHRLEGEVSSETIFDACIELYDFTQAIRHSSV